MSKFLTPKWARRAVAGLDGRRAHDILVRARTAAIFYFVLGTSFGVVLALSGVMAFGN